MEIVVRPATPADAPAVAEIHRASWGGNVVVGHGVRYELDRLPTLVAVDSSGAVVGALTYHLTTSDLEVVSIDAAAPGGGAGTLLLAAAADEARRRGLRRLWLVTTNDNLDALRFYQRRGLRIAAVRPGEIERSRALKPEIPEIGAYGIPIRDEIELELPIPEA